MLIFLCSLSFFAVTWAQNNAISVADLPQCARDCLSNSTSVVATSCASLNVACLCNTPTFVSTFYCCLSTQCNTAEQATAITFNQQQCAAVNATAPDFVGCSPLKTTSSLDGSKTATTVTPGNAGPYSTVTAIFSELASFSATSRTTATYTGQPLLTGSCTLPLFAVLSVTSGAQLFPEVGCASIREDCCPFDSNTDAVITRCPSDYVTTAGGCCPSGYRVYSSAIGVETPCYSTLSTVLIPATTPSIANLTITTSIVFSRWYPLVPSQQGSLSAGLIAGITVVSVAFVLITAVIILWVKRKQNSQIVEKEKSGTTFPLEEPVLPPQQDLTSPQELASPEVFGHRSPIRSFWPVGSFSASSARERAKPAPLTAKTFTPQELPGSTYMNEHRPVFTESELVANEAAAEGRPSTPKRSPLNSVTKSPITSPLPENPESRAMSPDYISPLSSPGLSQTTAKKEYY